ncbi:MAG: ECF transporter S component [Calditrichota bacterium]
MNNRNETNLHLLTSASVLRLEGIWAFAVPVGFVAAAVAAPAVCHLLGAPVRWILPMHWPILLAGLLYGWRAGLLTGLAAPTSNWLLTGYPLPMVLPAMTLELMVYGFLSGWLVEKRRWNRFLAISVAVLTGRLVFLTAVILTHGYKGEFSEYFVAAMIPGLAGAVGQIFLLPIAAKALISKTDNL